LIEDFRYNFRRILRLVLLQGLRSSGIAALARVLLAVALS